jgi:hypothetical protein
MKSRFEWYSRTWKRIPEYVLNPLLKHYHRREVRRRAQVGLDKPFSGKELVSRFVREKFPRPQLRDAEFCHVLHQPAEERVPDAAFQPLRAAHHVDAQRYRVVPLLFQAAVAHGSFVFPGQVVASQPSRLIEGFPVPKPLGVFIRGEGDRLVGQVKQQVEVSGLEGENLNCQEIFYLIALRLGYKSGT